MFTKMLELNTDISLGRKVSGVELVGAAAVAVRDGTYPHIERSLDDRSPEGGFEVGAVDVDGHFLLRIVCDVDGRYENISPSGIYQELLVILMVSDAISPFVTFGNPPPALEGIGKKLASYASAVERTVYLDGINRITDRILSGRS